MTFSCASYSYNSKSCNYIFRQISRLHMLNVTELYPGYCVLDRWTFVFATFSAAGLWTDFITAFKVPRSQSQLLINIGALMKPIWHFGPPVPLKKEQRSRGMITIGDDGRRENKQAGGSHRKLILIIVFLLLLGLWQLVALHVNCFSQSVALCVCIFRFTWCRRWISCSMMMRVHTQQLCRAKRSTAFLKQLEL